MEEERIFIINKIDKEIKENRRDAIFYGGFSALSLAALFTGAHILTGENASVANIFATGALSGSLFAFNFGNSMQAIRKVVDLKNDRKLEEMSGEIEEILESEKGMSK